MLKIYPPYLLSADRAYTIIIYRTEYFYLCTNKSKLYVITQCDLLIKTFYKGVKTE